MSLIKEIFNTIEAGNETELDYSFNSEKDMDNIESMSQFVEEHGLEEYITEDLGTLVILEHPEYNFKVSVTSEGLGDFFSHGIYLAKSVED